jgi:hypothetical protein
MSPRDTTTGQVLEQMVVPALLRGGYEVKQQVVIEDRPGGGTHRVDAVARKEGSEILVSLKWQQVSGTAEQKVPFEVISLVKAVQAGGFAKAYLVLGGEGWTLRDYFTSGELSEHLKDSELVRIVTLEGFIALANSGRL